MVVRTEGRVGNGTPSETDGTAHFDHYARVVEYAIEQGKDA